MDCLILVAAETEFNFAIKNTLDQPQLLIQGFETILAAKLGAATFNLLG